MSCQEQVSEARGHWGDAAPLHLTPAVSSDREGAGVQLYQKSPGKPAAAMLLLNYQSDMELRGYRGRGL